MARTRYKIPGALPRYDKALVEINISAARHLAVYAPPRQGKTTLLRGLALALPKGTSLVVVDTAQRGDWGELGPVTSDPDAIGDPEQYPAVVWQPDLAAVQNPAADGSDPWSRGWWYLWNVRAALDPETGEPAAGVTVVVDEPTEGVHNRPIELVRKAAIQGEGRRLAIWWGSQNVMSVYWRLRGNTLQRFSAPLPTAQDRGVLAADWGVEVPLAGPESVWGEFYWHVPGRLLAGPYVIRDLLPKAAARETLEIAERQRLEGR